MLERGWPLAAGWSLALLLLTGCQPGPSSPPRPALEGPGVTPLAELESLAKAAGQTIYLPIYSHVYSSNNAEPINLAVTVSIRNTDAQAPIVLRRATYHDSGGTMLREYLKTPVRIAPLAAAELFLAEGDTQGGSGASFLIEWLSDGPVSEPVVEAVHINTLSSQGLVFTTWGRPAVPSSNRRDEGVKVVPLTTRGTD